VGGILEEASQSQLEDIFTSLLTKKPIFRNREVMRHTYTPDNLPHREKQIKQLASILVAPLRGELSSNIFIFGKTGTGKTAVVKYVTNGLKKMGEEMERNIDVSYINCEVIDTQYRVLANLAPEFGAEVPMTGWPTDQVYKLFFKAIDSQERFVVIVLDEIDKLVKKGGDDILYNLTRINNDLNNAKVSVIGISNDLRFTEYLDPRVRSSLSQEELVFPPYNALELQDIMWQRAKVGLEPGVLSDGVIPLCAALAAREHGDARRALDLLRIAGEIAEREESPKITENHVRAALDKIEKDRIVEVVRTLPTQSKLVLQAILILEQRGEGVITTGEVYACYENLCKKRSFEILTQRRVSDLISELDMLGIINARVISKGRYGRTKEIRMASSIDRIQQILNMGV